MLSRTSDYALRAALVLGRAYGSHAVRADEIAVATGAPRNYMAKVLNALTKAGLVKSARGPTGGFALAMSPESITLADVIDRFDEPPHHDRCLLGNRPCNPLEPCAAHGAWTDVMKASRQPLIELTIADLIGGRTIKNSTNPSSPLSPPTAAITA